MQVTCPNCGARYAVDPLAIGPVGRIVQCARCSNRWLQTVAAAAAQAAARQVSDDALNPPQTPPGAGDVPVEAPVGEIPMRASSGPSLGSARAFEAIEPVPDLVIRPPRERNSLPAVIAPRRRSSLPVLAGVGIGVVLVVAATGAALYFYREPVLAKLAAVTRFLLNYL